MMDEDSDMMDEVSDMMDEDSEDLSNEYVPTMLYIISRLCSPESLERFTMQCARINAM